MNVAIQTYILKHLPKQAFKGSFLYLDEIGGAFVKWLGVDWFISLGIREINDFTQSAFPDEAKVILFVDQTSLDRVSKCYNNSTIQSITLFYPFAENLEELFPIKRSCTRQYISLPFCSQIFQSTFSLYSLNPILHSHIFPLTVFNMPKDFTHITNLHVDDIPWSVKSDLQDVSGQLFRFLQIFSFDVRESCFTLGKTSELIGETILELTNTCEYDFDKKASLMVVDRTMDLASPSYFGPFTLDRYGGRLLFAKTFLVMPNLVSWIIRIIFERTISTR
jgi:hypothetical protein